MSSKLDYLKTEIDDMDFDLFGDLWTVNGVEDIPGIKSEQVVDDMNIVLSALYIRFRLSDFPPNTEERSEIIRQSDNKVFIINRFIPDIDGHTEVLLSEKPY